MLASSWSEPPAIIAGMLFLISPAKSLDYDTPTPKPVARLATEPDAQGWAERLSRLLKPIIARPELHAPTDYGSRASGKPRHPAQQRG